MSLRKSCFGFGTFTFALLASAAVGQFNTAVDYAAPFDPEQAAAGDFDQDGDVDLAVTSDSPDKVSIFLNNGDGTFAAPVDINLASSSSPHGIAAGDFDNNGFLDLAVTREDLDDVQILENSGGASFSVGSVFAVGLRPVYVIAAQIDAGPSLDLVVSCRDSNEVSILINQGTGVFNTAVQVFAGADPRQVVAADLDEDDDMDLAIAAKDSNALVTLINDGTGVFSSGPTLSTGAIEPEGVTAADLDDDGDNDLVAAGTDSVSQHVALVFQHISPPGTFGSPVSYSTNGSEPGHLVAGDFDLDADFDLAVSHEISNDVGVLPNNGDGTFGSPVSFSVDSEPNHVVAAHLDGSGSLDLVTTNETGDSISVLMNAFVSAFTDLGFELAGTTTPHLAGTGTMQAGTFVQLEVHDGFPSAPAFLVIGLTRADLPFAGGTMVPFPDIIAILQLDANGEIELSDNWPAGITAGEDFFFQVWILDPAGPRNFSATNALRGVAQ